MISRGKTEYCIDYDFGEREQEAKWKRQVDNMCYVICLSVLL